MIASTRTSSAASLSAMSSSACAISSFITRASSSSAEARVCSSGSVKLASRRFVSIAIRIPPDRLTWNAVGGDSAATMRTPLPFRPRPVDCEWIGGRYAVPRPIMERGEPIYPEVDLWLELPRGVIVAVRLIDPREPIPFGLSLQGTMRLPDEGSPRRPARIRVAEERLAREVRAVAGSDISVIAGPIPELDGAFEELTEAFAAE